MNSWLIGFPPISSRIGRFIVQPQKLSQKKRRSKRAKKIAKVLSDNERWHSRGRMISRDTLLSDPIRLQIEKLEDTPRLSSALDDYVELLKNYVEKECLSSFVHTCRYFHREQGGSQWRNSRQTPISSTTEEVEKNTSDSADTTILKNNPKDWPSVFRGIWTSDCRFKGCYSRYARCGLQHSTPICLQG